MHNCHFAITGPDVKILVIEVAGHRRHRPGERLSLSLSVSLFLCRGEMQRCRLGQQTGTSRQLWLTFKRVRRT
ncbi:hypothetical protein ILYODFUR_022765 [Ilyodon furcidens]|uniref:Uncharacterized protein n=1 Tax=Ilyodon furcidens TaxID=33524 RepID=A0ABV0SQ97_9TELE